MVNCFLVKLSQVKALVYIVLILLVEVYVDAFGPEVENTRCGECNEEYKKLTRDYSDRMKDAARHWCAALNKYQRCIKALENICRSDLNFHAGETLNAAHRKKFKCDHMQLTWNETLTILTKFHINPKLGPCRRPQYKPKYKICGLFGDPHLRTFSNKRHTCSVPGAWPLFDNRRLTVQVTNINLESGTRATATSKVTVIVKAWKRRCIKAKTYQAKRSFLPAVFSDGTKSSEDGPCSTRIKQLERGRVVLLDICPLKTMIFIRRVGKYLTVHMRVPKDLTKRDTQGLCQRGCPRIEQMNNDKMSRIKNLIAPFTKDTVSKRVKRQRRKRARRLCKKATLSGFYYKSCMFDLLTSNDTSFVQAAQTAMKDFREINVDDNGRPIVNETSRNFRPTKRPLKLNTLRTQSTFNTPVASSSAASIGRTSLLTSLSTLIVLSGAICERTLLC